MIARLTPRLSRPQEMPALSKRKVHGKSSGGRPKKSKEAELPLESNDEPVPDESALGSNGNLQPTGQVVIAP